MALQIPVQLVLPQTGLAWSSMLDQKNCRSRTQGAVHSQRFVCLTQAM